jgi:hypothetical protein
MLLAMAYDGTGESLVLWVDLKGSSCQTSEYAWISEYGWR